jgi:hypothetical protein
MVNCQFETSYYIVRLFPFRLAPHIAHSTTVQPLQTVIAHQPGLTSRIPVGPCLAMEPPNVSCGRHTKPRLRTRIDMSIQATPYNLLHCHSPLLSRLENPKDGSLQFHLHIDRAMRGTAFRLTCLQSLLPTPRRNLPGSLRQASSNPIHGLSQDHGHRIVVSCPFSCRTSSKHHKGRGRPPFRCQLRDSRLDRWRSIRI